ncbi:MAG: allantoicase, partial [Gammaproteobacteria bacterium]|nr:allantoicase [Gammaproteobacteria bacterium]
QHYFEAELQAIGTVSHVRMSIYPDGGVSRLRLYGRLAR